MGYRNYKAFLLFIFYTTIYSVSHLITFALILQEYGIWYSFINIKRFNYNGILGGIIGLVFFPAVFGFSIMHILMVARNKYLFYLSNFRTTIESLWKYRCIELDGNCLNVRESVFDLGTSRNFSEVFGGSVWHALIPVVINGKNNGHEFDINPVLLLQNV